MQHYIHSNESMTNKEYQLFTRQVCKYSKDNTISTIVLGLKDTFTSIQNVIKNNNGERKELLLDLPEGTKWIYIPNKNKKENQHDDE